MVTIIPQNITEFDLSIHRRSYDKVVSYGTIVKNMSLKFSQQMEDALEFNATIRCEFQFFSSDKYRPLQSISRNISNIRMGAILERSYLLSPLKEIDLNVIYRCLGKSIDRIQETLNVVYNAEPDIPVVQLIPFNQIEPSIINLFTNFLH